MPSSSPVGDLGPLLLADGRLPTGGYAHSGGLEPAIAAGLPLDAVPDYLRARIRTVGRVDATAAVLAHRSVTPDGGGPRAVDRMAARLAAVDAALAARTPSAPLRDASRALGRGLARLTSRQFPDAGGTVALDSLRPRALRPVSLGVLAALLGMSEHDTARASLYEDAQTVAAASLKLLPVDPTDTAGWILDLADDIAAAVNAAVTVTDVADLPACSTPLIEQYSLAHHHSTRRIFVA